MFSSYYVVQKDGDDGGGPGRLAARVDRIRARQLAGGRGANPSDDNSAQSSDNQESEEDEEDSEDSPQSSFSGNDGER